MANDQQNTAQRVNENAGVPPARVDSYFFATYQRLPSSDDPKQHRCFSHDVWHVKTRMTRMANEERTTAQRARENARAPPGRVDPHSFETSHLERVP